MAQSKTKQHLENMVGGLLAGEVKALSWAISAVENRAPIAAPLLKALPKTSALAPVIGITGAPGVGKSTLIDAFIAESRARLSSVAVISVDPSSPINGGAILGDRLRMARHIEDPGIYIRSLASRGHVGGLCKNVGDILRVVRAAGVWDTIIVETVGVGQSEVEISRFADLTIVVCMPGQGDEIQAMKSGILEIANILVVNKGDIANADQTMRELRAMLKRRHGSKQSVPVIKTIATREEGIGELHDTVNSLMAARS